jgi:hypothetical protein
MKAADLVEFAHRDRSEAAALKARYWAERKRRLGPAEGLRVSAELLRQVRLTRPDWPDEAERAQDLATHVRVAEALRRVPRSRPA